MEVPLRAALITWIGADTSLAGSLNAVTEEAPLRASLPWLAIAASASIDWSTKTETGAETRIAFELHCRGDRPDVAGDLVTAIQQRIRSLPRDQAGFRVAGIQFLRSRAEQRADNTRAILLEYRIRTLAN